MESKNNVWYGKRNEFTAEFTGSPNNEPGGTTKNESGTYYDYRTACKGHCSSGDRFIASEIDDCLWFKKRHHCVRPTSTIYMGQVGGKGHRPHPTTLSTNNNTTVTIGSPSFSGNTLKQKYDLDKIDYADWESTYLNVQGHVQDLYPHLSGSRKGTMWDAWLTRYCGKGDNMTADNLCAGKAKAQDQLPALAEKCIKPSDFTRSECIGLLDPNAGDQYKKEWDTAIQNYCNEHPEKDACACMNQLRTWESDTDGDVPWCAKPGNEAMPGCKLINQDYNAIKDLPGGTSVKSKLIAGLSCRIEECMDSHVQTNLITSNPPTQCASQDQFCFIMNNEINNANIKAGDVGVDMSCDQSQTTNSGDSSSTNNNTTTSTFFGSGDSVFVNKDGSFPMITFVLIGVIGLLVLVILFTLLGENGKANKNVTKQVVVPGNHA